MPAYLTTNIIPTMMNASSPSGVVTSSGDNSTTFANWKLFDKVAATGWASNTANTGWVAYKFQESKVIYKYAISTLGTAYTQSPSSWMFQGSNDGSGWINLDTRSGITNWSASVLRQEFTISSPQLFSQYRINVTSIPSTGSVVMVGELEMYEMTYSNKFLISSGDKYYSLSPKKRTGEYMIPIMTSNKDSLTGIELTGDPKTSTAWGAWAAFDRVTVKPGLAWISETSQSEAGWIVMYIPNNKTVPFSYVIQGYLSGMTDLNYVPTAWNFYGSHNGTNWTILDSQTGVTGWVDGAYKEYPLTINEAHQYYKIEITANPNGRKSIGDFNIIAGTSNACSIIDKSAIGEMDFINYGLNKNDKIDLNDKIPIRKHIVPDSVTLGSGKVYKKIIDPSKITIKKVTIT